MASSNPESHEKTLLRLRVILHTFDEDTNQWKHGSIGHATLLQHSETAAVRLLVLEYKTLKVLANHPITASTKILEHGTVDRACLWNCKYFADGELKKETLLAQFNSTDNSQKFRETVEKIARSAGKKEGAPAEVDSAAGSVDKAAAGERSEEAARISLNKTLLRLKAILYSFDKDGNRWKVKGRGYLMLMEHDESGNHHLLMLEEKTLKVLAEHLVTPSMKVVEHLSVDRASLWIGSDFADGEVKEETFCAKFASAGKSRKFREAIEKVARSASEQEGAPGEQVGSGAGAGVESLAVGKGKEKAGVME